MPRLLGTFENKVDKKGRVSLPARFRAQLPEGDERVIYVYRSLHLPALEAGDAAYMDKLAAHLERFDMFSEEEAELSAVILSDARELTLDSEGRVMLPPEHADHAGISDRVAFAGQGDHFQIWQPEALSAHQEAARGRARAKGLTIPRTPREPQT